LKRKQTATNPIDKLFAKGNITRRLMFGIRHNLLVSLRVRSKINLQFCRVQAPAQQGAKIKEYTHIGYFRNAAERDAWALKM
jgi:hypothetical protein